MKATLEFNLPDDEHEFQAAVNGAKMRLALWDIDQWLRGQTKHAPDDMSQDTYDALILSREKLHQIMNSYNVNFD